MPDGSDVPWDYDTVRKIAKILTVDKNGEDATEAGFDPENIVQWGLEPQRDDIRQTGAYWKAGSFVAADGKTVADPGRLGGRLEVVLRRDLDRPHRRSTGPQFQNTDFNPNGYPFFTGKVAMSPNYLWSLVRRRATPATTGTWRRRRRTRARRPRRSTPTRSAS